jgi:hypothetical protein
MSEISMGPNSDQKKHNNSALGDVSTSDLCMLLHLVIGDVSLSRGLKTVKLMPWQGDGAGDDISSSSLDLQLKMG